MKLKLHFKIFSLFFLIHLTTTNGLLKQSSKDDINIQKITQNIEEGVNENKNNLQREGFLLRTINSKNHQLIPLLCVMLGILLSFVWIFFCVVYK